MVGKSYIETICPETTALTLYLDPLLAMLTVICTEYSMIKKLWGSEDPRVINIVLLSW